MENISNLLDAFFSSYAPSLSNKLRENRIERMELLLSTIGNPERSFKSLHIAGSKGKGTTASALSLLLSASGEKTGLYLSPHVYDIRERFTLSTIFFTDDEYLKSLKSLKEKIEGFTFPIELGESRPTTFELYTAYSYLLFKESGCTWAVIETGLGGRLDATNTILPEASVITAIEKEHTKILGDTISMIAAEKGGIIKEKRPTFLLKGDRDAENTIKRITDAKNSRLYIYSPEDVEIENEYGINNLTYRGVNLNLWTYKGDIKLVDILFSVYILTSLGLIKDGLTFSFLPPSFNLPGRFERRSLFNRLFIMDGAHTPSSIVYLSSALSKMTERKATLIFSAAVDKDWVNMAKVILPLFETVIVSSCGEWKKSDPESIYRDLSTLFPDKKIMLLRGAEDALDKALSESREDDIIAATGSFYLLSELDRALKGRESGA